MYSRVRQSAMCYPQRFGTFNLQKKKFLVTLNSFKKKYNSEILFSEALLLKTLTFALKIFFSCSSVSKLSESARQKMTDPKPWPFSHPF